MTNLPPARPLATSAKTRLAGLDGLRALAVGAVIAYHFLPGIVPGGFVGVDIFFVISGFLITTLLMDERAASGTISLRGFWLRRARRLLPALVLLILVCSTAVLAVRGDLFVRLGRQILGAATFSSNWIFIAQNSTYFGHGAPQLFRNLWSLAVEEQFYVLWPLLLLVLFLVRSSGIRFVILLALAAASAAEIGILYVPGTDPSRVYYGSDTHSFGLMLGAALAILVRWERPLDPDFGETRWQAFCRRNAGWIGVLSLAGVIVAIVVLPDSAAFTYRGGLALVSILTAAVIWTATRPGSLLGRALDARPLRAAGRRSYGLYLWHWPVLVLIQAATPDWSASPSGRWLVAGLALAVTIPAAALSYRYVEEPIRKNGLRSLRFLAVPRPRRPLGLAAMALVPALLLAAGVGTAAAIAEGTTTTAAQRYVERGERAIAEAAHRAGRSPAPEPSATPSATPPTAPPGRASGAAGGTTSTTVPMTLMPPQPGGQITAIGDSVMLASAPSLEAEFPGIAINAVVSRQAREAPSLVQSLAAAGQLRQTIVIGLGTNGFLGTGTLQAIRAAAGPTRNLVFVNIYADRPWNTEVNTDLAAFVAADPHASLADWHDAIAPHTDLLAPDGIHPGSAGGVIYANCVGLALNRLAAH